MSPTIESVMSMLSLTSILLMLSDPLHLSFCLVLC